MRSIEHDLPGGALRVRPGWPRPHNLRSTRPDWVGRATRGRPASELPATLGRLFGLCSHAHLACASLAVQAALGRNDGVDGALRHSVKLQTSRDHVQHFWLEAPRWLASAADARAMQGRSGGALACCPAFAVAPVPGALAAWWQQQVLGLPAANWLAAWQRDPAGWLEAWSSQTGGDIPSLFQACRDVASTPVPTVPALQVHADSAAMRVLADCLRDDAGLARQPRWRGSCAETGCWTRLGDVATHRLDTPWLRLGARLADALRLALPDDPARGGAGWLALGALPLAAGAGIAWVEMARGLLIHRVVLDGQGDTAVVADCKVIAPTDWNFNPDGAVAQAVAALPRQPSTDARRRLGVLLAAYSPCVPVQTDWQAEPVEVAHA